MKLSKILISVGTIAVLFLVGGFLKTTEPFDADGYLTRKMNELWRKAEAGELNAESGASQSDLSVVSREYHQGDGECLMYGIDADTITEREYLLVLADVVKSGLYDKMDDCSARWMVLSFDDEREGHGPRSNEEVVESLCLGVGFFECVQIKMNAEDLRIAVDARDQLDMQSIRDRANRIDAKLDATSTEAMGLLWKKHKRILSTPLAILRLMDRWEPMVTKKRAEMLAITVLEWAVSNGKMPGTLDEIYHDYAPRPKDAWYMDLTYALGESTFTILSQGEDAKPGGQGKNADILVEHTIPSKLGIEN